MAPSSSIVVHYPTIESASTGKGLKGDNPQGGSWHGALNREVPAVAHRSRVEICAVELAHVTQHGTNKRRFPNLRRFPIGVMCVECGV